MHNGLLRPRQEFGLEIVQKLSTQRRRPPGSGFRLADQALLEGTREALPEDVPAEPGMALEDRLVEARRQARGIQHELEKQLVRGARLQLGLVIAALHGLHVHHQRAEQAVRVRSGLAGLA